MRAQELQRYLAQVNLLAAKPYNASFFAAQDHTYRDYGSFNTSRWTATRYGGRINWATDDIHPERGLGLSG